MNGLTETTTFNNRLQVSGITAAVNGQGPPLSLAYSYCPDYSASCASNNGNLWQQIITRQNTPQGATQSWIEQYGHDGVNRLLTASEGSSSWSQTYNYDAFGNRAVSGTIPNLDWTPTDILKFTNNQWIRGAGDHYDTAGYMKTIASASSTGTPSSAFTFDAENRMISSNMMNL